MLPRYFTFASNCAFNCIHLWPILNISYGILWQTCYHAKWILHPIVHNLHHEVAHFDVRKHNSYGIRNTFRICWHICMRTFNCIHLITHSCLIWHLNIFVDKHVTTLFHFCIQLTFHYNSHMYSHMLHSYIYISQ